MDVEFLRKFENHGYKILELTRFLSPKSINLFKFCTVLGVSCDVYIFKLTASAQSINREVYGLISAIV